MKDHGPWCRSHLCWREIVLGRQGLKPQKLKNFLKTLRAFLRWCRVRTHHLSWCSELFHQWESHPPSLYSSAMGLKIIMVEYLKILDKVVLLLIEKNYDPVKVLFIQDSAPARGSKTMLTFLKRERVNYYIIIVSSNVWLSISPDFNSCDHW